MSFGKKNLQKKSFNKTPTNYISEERLINVVCDKNSISTRRFRKCQEPVRLKTTDSCGHIYIEKQKICNTCCVNGRPEKNTMFIQISPYVFFVTIPEIFWQNFTKIGQLCLPYKFAQCGCMLSQIKCEILDLKDS